MIVPRRPDEVNRAAARKTATDHPVQFIVRELEESRGAAMIAWLLCNIVLPLSMLPVILLICRALNSNKNLFEMIKDGQLSIFSALLGAATIYDVSKEAEKLSKIKYLYDLIDFTTIEIVLILVSLYAMVFYGVAVVVNFANVSAADAASPHGHLLGKISICVLILAVTVVFGIRYGLGVF